MTTQYNVNIVGNLTNDNGVLSGFSVNDYATLPETLEGLTINNLEIVFKFKTNSLSSNNAIFWTDKLTDDPLIPWAGLRLCNYNVDNYVFDLEVTDNNAQIADIYSTTAILPNKYYYIKALYSDTDGYSLYSSEDGENYTLIGTNATTDMPPNSQAIIGRAVDTDPMPLDGSIDLNESYIKVNGVIWWGGAENITKIQLRHDTAANWTSVNPVLLEGEVGIETDTRKQKFGDGVTAWNSLPYDKGSTALQSSDIDQTFNFTSTHAQSGVAINNRINNETSSIHAWCYENFATQTDISDMATQTWVGQQGYLTAITSSDVTNALGYTPYNSTNPNGYISGITSSDVTNALGYTPVNKAGDTMTGILQIRRESGNEFLQMYPNVSLTTPPASTRNLAMLVNYDVNSNVMAKVLQVLYSDGGNSIKFSAFRPNNSGEVSAFEVGWGASGNRYCTFPNTTCCDGQWVYKYLQIATAVTVASDTTYTYDLSSYLPVDNYNYEVFYTISAATDATANKSVDLRVSSSILTSSLIPTTRVKAVNAVSALSSGLGIIPIGTDRKIYVTCAQNANTGGKIEMFRVGGYRRIGTNA